MNEDPLLLPEEREESFWHTLLLVLAGHVAAICIVWLIGGWKKKPEQITWLSGDGLGDLGAPAAPPSGGMAKVSAALPEKAKPAAETREEASLPPIPDEPPPEPPKPKAELPPPPPPHHTEAPELVEKKSTPAPTPKLAPKPEPKPKPKPEPEPTPKPKSTAPDPKKTTSTPPKPKATPEPAKVTKAEPKKSSNAPEQAKVATPKSSETKPSEAKSSEAKASDKSSSSSTTPKITREGANGSGEANNSANTGAGKSAAPGPDRQALRGTYGSIVGGRFKSAGEPRKPTSVGGDNHEFTTLMRFKIARDGSVISVVVVTPSGNTLVDNWIRDTIPDFQHVPPPPSELLKDGVYEDSMEVIYEL